MTETYDIVKEVLDAFKAWKGDHNDDYVYDEIHDFFSGTLDRGDLCAIIEFFEKEANK